MGATCASMPATASSTCASSVTSKGRTWAAMPSAPSSSFTFSRASACRLFSTIRAPALPSPRASTLPSPREEPVTRAVFPVKSKRAMLLVMLGP